MDMHYTPEIYRHIATWKTPSPARLTQHGLPILNGAVTIPSDILRAGVVLRPGDSAVIAGSLVEGFGNALSDIDIHIICAKRPTLSDFAAGAQHRLLTPDRRILRHYSADALDSEVLLAHSLVPGTSIKIDVEYTTTKEFDKIASDIDELFDYARSNLVLLTRDVSDRHKSLIHRISSGIAFEDAPLPLLSEALLTKFRYLLYRWFASDFMMLLDCLGAWRQGDLLRAVDIARESLLHQANAFNALLGCLNGSRKWIPVYLARLYDGPSDIVQAFLRLYTGAPGTSLEEMQTYLRDVFDLIDRFYDEGRDRLAQIPGIPVAQEAVDLLAIDRDLCRDNSPYADAEFAYRSKAYQKIMRSSIDLVDLLDA